MIVRISVGLLSIFALLVSSACTTLENSTRQSSQRRTVGQRAERFVKSVTHTMTEAASDVLPIFAATVDEIVSEVKSDLPKVTEELSKELSRTAPMRR